MIMGVVGIFIAILSFAVLLETPRKYLIPAGLTGALSGFIYLICTHYNMDVVYASFLSAMGASLMSHLCARKLKAPGTLFLVAGILPTVPGSGMYQIVYQMLNGTQDMVVHYVIQTLQIAGAIALAIFILDTVFRSGRKLRSLRHSTQK